MATDECLKVFYPEAETVRKMATTIPKLGLIKAIDWQEINRISGG